MKRRLGYIFLALFTLAAIPAYAAKDAQQLNSDGVALYGAGNYAAAEKRFMEALSVNPKQVSSLYMMGEVLSRDILRLKESEGWYKKALRDGATDHTVVPKTLFSLGVLYVHMGRYEDAMTSFNDLLSKSPAFYDSAKAYNHMGIACYRLDRYDEAMAFFKKALKNDPNLMEAVFNMKALQGQLSLLNTARYYQRLGNVDGAIEQYNAAVEAYPNYVAAWYQFGMVYLEKKDFQMAVKLLVRAKALNPKYLGGGEVQYRLADAYSGLGDAASVEAALKLYNANPTFKDSMLKAGVIYMGQARYDLAEKALSSATSGGENKKSQAEAWYQLGVCCQKMGEAFRATPDFQKALEIMPSEERYKNPPSL